MLFRKLKHLQVSSRGAAAYEAAIGICLAVALIPAVGTLSTATNSTFFQVAQDKNLDAGFGEVTMGGYRGQLLNTGGGTDGTINNPRRTVTEIEEGPGNPDVSLIW